MPPPFHGSSVYLKKLVSFLEQDGHLQSFVVDTSDKREDLNNMGRFDYRNIVAALKAIWDTILALKAHRPSVVYVPVSQNAGGYLRDGFLFIISKAFGSRVLIHLHGSNFRRFYGNSNFLVRTFIDCTMREVDAAIVLGDKLQPIFKKWLPPEHIFVLPNFVNWSCKCSSRVERRDGEVVLTYLGNIRESKGIFEFLEAAHMTISNTERKIKFKVAGKFRDDPFTGMTEIQTISKFRAKASSIGPNIEYIGPVNEESVKRELLEGTDIFVFPSWLEGQPLVILEAMSAGCPVISTKGVGAIDETVLDGFTGILVRQKAVSELTNAMVKLVADDELRKKMSANALSEFKRRFTPEQHLREFKRIVDIVCAG